MGLATQLLRITLFSFFSFLATNGFGGRDTGAGTLAQQVDSVVALVVGIGGHLATLGWCRRTSRSPV